MNAKDGAWTDLGRMPYSACTELQKRVLTQVAQGTLPNTLLFVEHEPAVFSLGAGFKEEHLLRTREEYKRLGFDVEPTERGGDVTFHGEDQLVAYPIFHLDLVQRDLHRWLRDLEEAIILALKTWNIAGYRFPPHTGVWVNGAKICAIGVKVRKWVSMHGIALNVSNDLSPFELIVPCGIEGYGVTSIQKELGRPIPLEEARRATRRAFEEVFGISLKEVSQETLHNRLSERAAP